jgi:lipoyl(octanoyl) transferase
VTWRLVLGGGGRLQPLRGAANMALDAALFESVLAGGPPVLRFYLWAPACLSLGRNQPARAIYDPKLASAHGIDIVRRPTGGLAVLHDAEVTYSLMAPMQILGRPRAAYVRANEWLIAALTRLGISAAVAPAHARGGGWRPGQPVAPCFAEPAAGEILAAGRKLVGSAQRCERRCILQHGSILLSGDQRRVQLLQRAPAGAAVRQAAGAPPVDPPPAGQPAAGQPPAGQPPAGQPPAGQPPAGQPPAGPAGSVSLEELLGRAVRAEDVVAAACEAFVAGNGTCLAPARISRMERRHAERLQAQFDSVDWTWRR